MCRKMNTATKISTQSFYEYVRDRVMLGLKYAEFCRNRYLSRADFEERKLRKFRKLVAYAGRHSAYYREIILDRNIDIKRCIPSDFPILDKQILLENFDRIITDQKIKKNDVADFVSRSKSPHDLFLNKYHVIHSSGTSGQLGYFLYSHKDWLKGLAHGLRLHGWKSLCAKRHMALICSTGGHYGGEVTFTTGIYNAHNKRHNIIVYEANDPLQNIVDGLNAFQPQIIGGYTTILRILAEQIYAKRLHISPKYIEAIGENVSASDKQYLEKAFGVKLFNIYGCSDHIFLGIAKPDEDHLTLYDDDLILEMNSEYTLITNLFNYTMPLIRYKQNDILELCPVSQQNGPYLKIQNLVGRKEAKAEFINQHGEKDYITSVFLDDTLPGVRRFQMKPLSLESFQFMICLEGKDAALTQDEIVRKVRDWLGNILRQKEMGNVHYNIEVVDDIPISTVTRKFQLIAS